ncbi:MAG: CAP domain-containing protein [Parvibaculum sp.]|nr:CAP domain-containing protein [Parvibaculum sp.]
MRPTRLPIAALAAISMLAACAPGPVREQPPVNVSTASLPAAASAAAEADTPLGRAVTMAVNDWRKTRGAGPLATDATLQRAAAVHAADMALRGYFGHHNPEGQGPRERVLAVDKNFSGRISENVQVVDGPSYAAMSDAALAKLMVEKWAQSPQHRQNMQAAEATRSGVGIGRAGTRIIAVQVFAGN